MKNNTIKLSLRVQSEQNVLVKLEFYDALNHIQSMLEHERKTFLWEVLESGNYFITPDNIISLIDILTNDKGRVIDFLFKNNSLAHLITAHNLIYLLSNCYDLHLCVKRLFILPNLESVMTELNLKEILNNLKFLWSAPRDVIIDKLLDLPELHKLITSENALEIANQKTNDPQIFVLRLLGAQDLHGSITQTNIIPLLQHAIASGAKAENANLINNILHEKLLALTNFQTVITSSNIKELAALPGFQAKNLINKISEKNLDLQELFSQLDLGILHSDDLALFASKVPSALEILNRNGMHYHDPIINGLLSKIYTNILNPQAILSDVIINLQRVIETNLVLKKVLERAWQEEGSIFIFNSSTLKGAKGLAATGLFDGSNSSITVAAMERSADSIVATIVHEATHKLINKYFNNQSRPYAQGEDESFSHIVEAAKVQGNISMEVEKFYFEVNKLVSRLESASSPVSAFKESWLKSMIGLYDEVKWDIELPAWFTTQIVHVILGNVDDGNIERDLAQDLWNFLLQITGCEPEALPESYCIPNSRSMPSLTILLEKLHDAEGANNFFRCMLNLPAKELFLILKEDNIANFFKSCNTVFHGRFICKLLDDVPPELSCFVITEGNIASIIESCYYRQRGKLIEKIFEKLLHKVITFENIVKIAKASVDHETGAEYGRKAIIKCLSELHPSDAQKIMKFGSHGSNPLDVMEAIGNNCEIEIVAGFGSYIEEELCNRLCKLLLPKGSDGYSDDVEREEVKADCCTVIGHPFIAHEHEAFLDQCVKVIGVTNDAYVTDA